MEPSVTRTPSKGQRITGHVLSGLAVLFMLVDAGGKLAGIQPVKDSFVQMQIPVHLAGTVGLLGLVCTVLYAVPRTAVLGAILLTGYLGGAVATHLRLENPLFSHTLFPVYLGATVWAGLLLRAPRVRELLLAPR